MTVADTVIRNSSIHRPDLSQLRRCLTSQYPILFRRRQTVNSMYDSKGVTFDFQICLLLVDKLGVVKLVV
jgi:hypothetical protein